jgi:hypothetical protein
MNIAPLGVIGSPLAQTRGSAQDRALEETTATRRATFHEEKAADAGAVVQPDGEDHEADQRDGDGRRPWEEPPDAEFSPDAKGGRKIRDPARPNGNILDLTG